MQWSVSHRSEGPRSRSQQPDIPKSHICHHKGQWLAFPSLISTGTAASSHAAGPLYSRITCRGSASLSMDYWCLCTPWGAVNFPRLFICHMIIFLFIKAIPAWNLLCPSISAPHRAETSYSDVHCCTLGRKETLMLARTLHVLKIWLECHSRLLLLISALAAMFWQRGRDPNPTGGSGKAPTCFIKFQAFSNE